MTMKFRKKPVVIEAVQFAGGPDGANAVFDTFDITGAKFVPDLFNADDPLGVGLISIPTLEGTMFASKGDWIIRGVKGEFYPVKPDIFDATYEAVVEGEPTQHGVNCPKRAHDRGGYLHDEEDDGPYTVDGLTYCGRCHLWLPDPAPEVKP